MRKIKDILRYRFETGLSLRGIALALNIGYGTVADYLKRAEVAGLGWPLPADLQERDLGRLLFPTQPRTGQRRFTEPDFTQVSQELKGKGVTKQLLWQEYRQQHPDDGYSYAQFCHRYRQWQGRQKRSMRQVHRAGEKLFVDYCGPTLPIVNPDTGEIREAQVFVAVLGASNYTFACASWSQNQVDWLQAHVKAFEFFGGVPEMVIPDNLKSAVLKTHRYEPDINPSYSQLAAHYGVAVIPARPYKPKDKAKVEVAVQIVERWIMARLRHQSFFTLASLNQAISLLLEDLNQRPFKQLPGCRRSQFEQLDQPVLRPLPARPYQYAEIKQAKVHIDYHIEYHKHYYSVPHHLVKQTVEVQARDTTVAIYHQGQRIASHVRSYRKGAHTTCAEHMPRLAPRHARLVARTLSALGRRYRQRDRRSGENLTATETPPGTKLPQHPGAAQPQQKVWPRAAQQRLRARVTHRFAQPSQCRIDPETGARSSAAGIDRRTAITPSRSP